MSLDIILVMAKVFFMSAASSAIAAIAEPRRRRILRLIWRRERSAGEIAAKMPVTFGAVSQHLRVLREAGLVVLRKDGRQRFYRADRTALGPFAAALEFMWGGALARLKAVAEQEERRGTRKRRRRSER